MNVERPWQSRCPRSDEVVAVLVDAAALPAAASDAAAVGAAVTLAQDCVAHAATCPWCARAVRESRRLDLLLARLPVPAVPDPQRVEAWLEAAVSDGVVGDAADDGSFDVRASGASASDASGGAARSTGRRPVGWWAVAAALLLGGAWLWGGRVFGDAETRVEPAPGGVARGPQVAGAPVAEVPIPAGPIAAGPNDAAPAATGTGAEPETGRSLPPFTQPVTQRSGMTRRSDFRQQRRRQPEAGMIMGWAENDRALAALGLARAWLEPVPAFTLPTRTAQWRERLRHAAVAGAVASLERSVGTEELRRLGEWTAPTASLADVVLDVARREPQFASALAADLGRANPARDHGWRLALATRLGGREVDVALRKAVAGGRLERGRLLLDLRVAPPRVGRGALLLAVCADAVRRGADAALVVDERALAGFAGAVAAEVVENLVSSQDAVERAVALRLLGVLAEPAVAPELLAIVHGVSRPEAELGAWALGRLPAGSDRLAPVQPGQRRSELVWAALCSRRDPAARARLKRMSLSDEERAFLVAGGFTPEQIRIAAALFARRSTHH